MREDALDDQRDLVELVENAGWNVTGTDLSLYESPWEDTGDPEATVTITARKVFSAEENDSGGGSPDDGDDGDNPFRMS